jgi:hypothetical protein
LNKSKKRKLTFKSILIATLNQIFKNELITKLKKLSNITT